MIIDPIGDLLTRIRNGQLRRKAKISSPNSRLRTRLLDVLLSPLTMGMAAAGVTTRRAATSIATRRLPAWTSVGLEGRHCTRRRGDRR